MRYTMFMKLTLQMKLKPHSSGYFLPKNKTKKLGGYDYGFF